MMRILIVEDEPPIARTLEHCIRQAGPEAYQVIDKAINGEHALEILRQTDIDVVFTDIRMPVMDGLELIGEIHNRYPGIVCVIVSGYQEFEYARTALRYKVFEYLLKPISLEEVEKLLQRLDSILQDRENLQKEEEFRQIIRGEKPTKKDEFYYTVLLICAGPYPAIGEDILLPGKLFWEMTDLNGLFEELFGSLDSLFVFDGKTISEKYVIFKNDLLPVRKMIQQLFEKLTMQKKIYITIVAAQAIAFDYVGESIRSLQSCLYREVQICSSKLVWNGDTAIHSESKSVFRPDLCQQIVEYICLQDEPKLLEATRQIIRPDGISQVEFMKMMDVIIADSRFAGDNYSAVLEEVKTGLNDAVSNSTTVPALCKSVTAVLLAMIQPESPKGKREIQETVEEIEKYLILNYSKSISSEILSKKFGFVPSYLSKIFREAKGISPSEYLIQYRVQKAKEIIRNQPFVKIRDVAKIVGYDDQYYFSKIFKKQTGIWPKEYQESYKNGE